MDNSVSTPLSISGLQIELKQGKTTVSATTRLYLDAINRYNEEINAYVSVNEHAQAEAKVLDALPSTQRGPLFGVPIAIKDQIETEGIRTTFGSQACSSYYPAKDATVIRKLKEAGAIILGKTSMPDWATSWFSTSSISGITRNPHDTSRDAGGSSSGSGAAVPAGMALAAIGGDTGGSIRLPSSFCGLVGVRVTPGRISRHGMSTLVEPQDTPGPMTRTVEDAARILDVIVGYDDEDPATAFNAAAPFSSKTPFQDALNSATLVGKRFGVLRGLFGSHAGVNEVLSTTLRNFTDAGAELITVEIPGIDEFRNDSSMYVPRAKSDINAFLASRPELAHLNLEQLHASGGCNEYLDLVDAIVQGPNDPASDIGKCFLEQVKFRQVVASLFAKHQLDSIIYPTCQLPAPKIQDVYSRRWTCLNYPTNTVIASQLLFPAISVPVGLAADTELEEHEPKLPVGLEMLGLPWCEESLIALASAVEATRPGVCAQVIINK